jgi:hypothetical protein
MLMNVKIIKPGFFLSICRLVGFNFHPNTFKWKALITLFQFIVDLYGTPSFVMFWNINNTALIRSHNSLWICVPTISEILFL